jgi:hypothetical protein
MCVDECMRKKVLVYLQLELVTLSIADYVDFSVYCANRAPVYYHDSNLDYNSEQNMILGDRL